VDAEQERRGAREGATQDAAAHTEDACGGAEGRQAGRMRSAGGTAVRGGVGTGAARATQQQHTDGASGGWWAEGGEHGGRDMLRQAVQVAMRA